MSEAFDEQAWLDLAPVMFDEGRWVEAAAEIDGALALLDLAPGAAVLDLACGPGRHVLELARRGFQVTGVDATAPFLEEARGRADAAALSAELVHEDMRSFRRPEAFDAVFSFATSFGYFADPADDRRVLDNVLASLRPGGTLLMELVGKEVVARTLKPREWNEEGGVLLLTERRIRDDWTWVDHRLLFVADDARREFVLSHRLYSAAELSALFTACGLEPVACFGDFGGSPYDAGATRLVALALKAEDSA